MQKAVVLLSGGLDSTTTLAIAKDRGFEVHALSFAYGQRHSAELLAAKRIADRYGVSQKVANVDLRLFGGSALTDDIDVPKLRTAEQMSDGIPVTYVPARNTIFLSFATAYAEVLDAHHIFIGVNALDYSGYPDCRPEYIRAYEAMANLATKAGVEAAAAGNKNLHIETPIIDKTKAEIIKWGIQLDVDYAMTVSCYDASPEGLACGECDSCFLRRKGFEEAGVKDDPTRYKVAAA